MKKTHKFIGQHHFCKCERSQPAEAFSAGTVNVAHHQVHVILSHVIESRLALRTDFPDVFVVPLTVRFLPGSHWITIIDPCADDIVNAAFKCIRMFELSTPVGKYQGEGSSEKACTNSFIDRVKYFFNT